MGFGHYEYLLWIVLLLTPTITRCFGVLVAGFLFPIPGSWLCDSVAVPWLWWPPAHSMVQMPKALVSSLLARATPHTRTRPALLAPPPTLFHLHVPSCCSHPVNLKCSPDILEYSILAVRNQGSESLLVPWSRGDRLGSPQKDEREEASLAWKQSWPTAGPLQAHFMRQLGYFVLGVFAKGKRASFEIALLPFLSWTQSI